MDKLDLLRPALEHDKIAIVALLHRTWRQAFAPHLPAEANDNYFAARIAENYVGTQWREMLVAESGRQIVGFGHAEDNLVSSLHVDPDHWGKGLGQRLLTALERQIAERGHFTSQLQVEDFNERAIGLYRRSGYREISRQPDQEFGSGGMAILMEKPLGGVAGRRAADC